MNTEINANELINELLAKIGDQHKENVMLSIQLDLLSKRIDEARKDVEDSGSDTV